MLGRPLWLSVAETVYARDVTTDPLSSLDERASTDDIVGALYPKWLDYHLTGHERMLKPLKYLATTMSANDQQTLYLQAIQPNWVFEERISRAARTVGAAISALITAGLALIISWLSFPLEARLSDAEIVAGSAWQDLMVFADRFLTTALPTGLCAGLITYIDLRAPTVAVNRAWSW